MTETVLVIGGTGQLGAPVAHQLRGDGYQVRVLARTLPAAPDATPVWSMSRTIASSTGDQPGSRSWPPRPASLA
jgi:uncharacterized protein YbjT (DUF2867 family)